MLCGDDSAGYADRAMPDRETTRRRLTIFAKGEEVRELPIPDPEFWKDPERLYVDLGVDGGTNADHRKPPRTRGFWSISGDGGVWCQHTVETVGWARAKPPASWPFSSCACYQLLPADYVLLEDQYNF
jgi:hypothetical protein